MSNQITKILYASLMHDKFIVKYDDTNCIVCIEPCILHIGFFALPVPTKIGNFTYAINDNIKPEQLINKKTMINESIPLLPGDELKVIAENVICFLQSINIMYTTVTENFRSLVILQDQKLRDLKISSTIIT